MTAADFNSSGGDSAGRLSAAAGVVVRHVDQTCQWVVDGRRAARLLTRWTRQFALSEPEFQLLRCLRAAADEGFDQTTIAKKLALSAAQVSATVERLRVQGWIALQVASADRRRHRWQLTAAGHALLHTMLNTAVAVEDLAREDAA